MNATDTRRLQNRIFRRYISRFVLYALLYTVAFGAFFALVYIWGHSRYWYTSDLMYGLLSFLNRNDALTFVAGWTLGVLALLLFQWRRIAKDMTALAAVIGKLATNPELPVELPAGLSDVELVLQKVQLDMLHSEERARDAEQRKNDLVIYLAHDLKTPLTSVLGYLTLLREEPNITPELQERYIGIATNKAQRLEDLVNEFFEITRFNLKGLVLEPTRFSLTRMLEQVNDEFRPLYSEKGLTTKVDIQPDVEVFADAGKLERVIDNLLRNAVNYSYPNSEIQLFMGLQKGYVTVAVQNRGDTIPEHKLVHIFEQFYRLDSSRSSEGGSGLGLAIAKEIAELHGGSITVQSKEERILFTLSIPQRCQNTPDVTQSTGTMPAQPPVTNL